MPSRTFHPLRDTFPLFYPLSKEAPTFSPSRDETKFIFLLPLLTNRIREKIPEGGDVFSKILLQIYSKHLKIFKKDYNFDLALGGGRINPSPSREPDIWGGEEEIAESRYEVDLEIGGKLEERGGGKLMAAF